ncbi:MAG: T9SS type A sorting domain-containing protein [Saprospiraceae bacterium]|nr:T9SS type A sorting domain-containing protein [Saprospiraceae bacterium]
MKQLFTKQTFSVTAIILLGFGARLSAQPAPIVSQGNLNQFIAEMDDYYSGMIDIPLANIGSYLSPLLPSQPNGCNHPIGITYEMTDLTAAFDWSNAPNASEYRVGYLNLKTGANTVTTTTTSQQQFAPLQNGFYLFVFQSKCGGSWSNAYIIIIEKVVALQINPLLSCDCSGLETLYSPGIDLLSYPEFQILLKIGFETVYSIKFVQQEGENEGNEFPIYDVNPNCGKLNLNFRNEIFYPATLNGYKSSLLFDEGENGELAIITNAGFPYSIYFKPCGQRQNRENTTINLTENATVTVQPNPVVDWCYLSIPGLNEAEVSITIWDMSGRMSTNFNLEVSASDHDLNLNLVSLPKGMYTLKISTKAWQESRLLVKQ